MHSPATMAYQTDGDKPPIKIRQRKGLLFPLFTQLPLLNRSSSARDLSSLGSNNLYLLAKSCSFPLRMGQLTADASFCMQKISPAQFGTHCVPNWRFLTRNLQIVLVKAPRKYAWSDLARIEFNNVQVYFPTGL